MTSTSPAESMIEIPGVHRLPREAAAFRKAVGTAKLSTVSRRLFRLAPCMSLLLEGDRKREAKKIGEFLGHCL